MNNFTSKLFKVNLTQLAWIVKIILVGIKEKNINQIYVIFLKGAGKMDIACKICGEKPKYISSTLGICLNCIRENPGKARPFIIEAHRKSRESYSLPVYPPRQTGGVRCTNCVNACIIGESKKGFCGLRENLNGQIYYLKNNKKDRAVADWYQDPLPTNCVADWVCPGYSSSGFPEYSYTEGAEYGYHNLAVFLGACSLDCLFCQNWHFREMAENLKPIGTVGELIGDIGYRTSCICFFGGDPSVQMEFALEAVTRALGSKRNKILRICWETNGTMDKRFLSEAVKLSLHSGGCIKFDLKAFDSSLFFALTGGSNKNTLENFRIASSFIPQREDPPLVIASTLLIPGYIDEDEIRNISRFIHSCNPDIPYKLLGFSPQFYMYDIPPTPKKLAYSCLKTAREAGLKNVDIGNRHLLT